MAKYKPPQTARPKIQLTGADEMQATYSEVFVVAHEKETGMSHIYFFQAQIPFSGLEEFGTVQMGERRKAKCVAHLVLTEKAMDALFRSIAENRGVASSAESEG